MFYGFGVNDDKANSVGARKPTPAYRCWYAMLYRCYSGKKPQYADCVVCDEWRSFKAFREWFEAHHKDGWELDKDILGNGLLYSPQTCVFVPKALNQFLTCTDGGKSKGATPGTFQSRIWKNGRRKSLGTFASKEEASAAWRAAKRQQIFDRRAELDEIDPRLFDALLLKIA